MIIQKVVKGISRITSIQEVNNLFESGIPSNLFTCFPNGLPIREITMRLTEGNLDWHQNRYTEPYPGTSPTDQPFCEQTPFISTTAGTVERDALNQRNIIYSAQEIALQFATQGWQVDGCLFYCYVFILGKKAVELQGFSEELRELNIYTGYSPFQPEGEITAKILIPGVQIERAELWSVRNFARGSSSGPDLVRTSSNRYYLPPENFHNIRELLV